LAAGDTGSSMGDNYVGTLTDGVLSAVGIGTNVSWPDVH